jgi:branched-subunit amino acid transport protein
MSLNGFIGDWHAIWMLLLAGVLPNGIWRVFGFLAGRRIDEGAEILVWVRAVATAIIGCVVMQILIMPPGALATVSTPVRFAAVAAGFVVYLLVKRSVLAGVIASELVLLGGKWWFG